jgi:uncharacterized protein (DUF58 family)
MREFEEESGRTVVVVLETAVEPEDTQAFESAVSYAASVALVLLRRGLRVGLVAGTSVVAPETGVCHGGHILRCLALVEPTTRGQSADERPAWARRDRPFLTVSPAPGHPRIEAGASMAMRRMA